MDKYLYFCTDTHCLAAAGVGVIACKQCIHSQFRKKWQEWVGMVGLPESLPPRYQGC